MSVETQDRTTTEFEGQVNEDLAKRAQEADLTAAGYYVAQLEKATPYGGPNDEKQKETFTRKDGTEFRNPFYNVPMGFLRFALLQMKEKPKSPFQSLEKPRYHNVKVALADVYKENGDLTEESKVWGYVIGAARKSGSTDTSNSGLINWLKDNMVVIHIPESEATDKYDAKNWIRSVKPMGS